MNGRVDRAGRALIDVSVRPGSGEQPRKIAAWVDTAFTGELVIPRREIDQLGLTQSSAVMAGLADGKEVVLETFSCVVDWFGERAIRIAWHRVVARPQVGSRLSTADANHFISISHGSIEGTCRQQPFGSTNHPHLH